MQHLQLHLLSLPMVMLNNPQAGKEDCSWLNSLKQKTESNNIPSLQSAILFE